MKKFVEELVVRSLRLNPLARIPLLMKRALRPIALRWSIGRALAERRRLRCGGWYRRRRAA